MTITIATINLKRYCFKNIFTPQNPDILMLKVMQILRNFVNLFSDQDKLEKNRPSVMSQHCLHTAKSLLPNFYQ